MKTSTFLVYITIVTSFTANLTANAASARRRRRPASVESAPADPAASLPPPPTTATASTKAPAPRHLIRPTRWGWTLGAVLWQEKIQIKSGADAGTLLTQSEGLQAGAVYDHPLRSLRWNAFYTGALQIGSLRGAGTTPVITDTFKDNRWYALQAAAGLMYRTTTVSSISLVLPLTYRMISWEIGPTSASRPDRRASGSIGYSGVFTTQFNARSSINFAFTHQQTWDATQWSVTYQRLL